jgi:peptidoglycan/LPS O-acetylase OafA/YrhL
MKYIKWIDFARGIAIIAVVMDHAILIFRSVYNNVIWQHMEFAVPWFVVIIGMTNGLSEKNRNNYTFGDMGKFWTRRFKTIFIPYFIASLFYYLVLAHREHTISEFLFLTFNFRVIPHFYFVHLLLQLYLIFPLLLCVAKITKKIWIHTIILIVMTLLTIVYFPVKSSPWTILVGQDFFARTYLAPFYFGIVYSLYHPFKHWTQKIGIWLLFLITEMIKSTTSIDSVAGIPNVVVILWSVSSLLVIKELYEMLPKNFIFNCIQYLGRKSFFIFLFHYAIIIFIYEQLKMPVTIPRFIFIISFSIGFSLLMDLFYFHVVRGIMKVSFVIKNSFKAKKTMCFCKQNRKLIKIFFLLSFLLIIFIRYLYHHYHPAYSSFPDSSHYVQRAQQIFQGGSIVNTFRLPGYPLFINATTKMDARPVNNYMDIFRYSYQKLIEWQAKIGLIGGLLFLCLVTFVFPDTIVFFILGLLFVFDITIFAWERILLPESISITIVIAILETLSLFVTRKKVIYLILSTVGIAVLFLFKPNYFLLSLFLYPILFFFFVRIRENKLALMCFICLGFSLFIPYYYAKENYRLTGYQGITSVSDYNLLGKILQYDMVRLDNSISTSDMYELRLNACLLKPPVDIDSCIYAIGIKNDNGRLKEYQYAGDFAKKIIFAHPFLYIIKSVSLVPSVLNGSVSDVYPWVAPYASNPLLFRFWLLLVKIYNCIHYAYIGFLIFYPLSLYLLVKKTNERNVILGLIGTTIAYQTVLNVFFSHADYIRLQVPIMPPLLMFCFYYYMKSISWLLRRVRVRNK